MVLKPGILGALIALVVALLVGLAIGALAQHRRWHLRGEAAQPQ